MDGSSGYERVFCFVLFLVMCKGPEVETFVYLGYSENNMEGSGAEPEYVGVKVVGHDEFRGVKGSDAGEGPWLLCFKR